MTPVADNSLPTLARRLWRWLSVRGEDCGWSGGNDDSWLARHRGRVMFALLLTAVIPRVIFAARMTAFCDDAYYYLWVAEMWKQGRTATALQSLNVNVYPLILWALQQTGLPAGLAATSWGVLVSGLTVLPLYGLLRRMFDDRVAAVSLLLFAVHPSLMEVSVEPIRDATFWFLFLLALYCLYRAAGERAGWWPACAGLAVALAVHTRTEGWALLVPLLLWPLCLAGDTVSWRRRLLRIGTAGCMIPAFLVAVNLTLLHGHDRWEWGRFAPLRNFIEWLRSDVSLERRQLERRKQTATDRTSPPVRMPPSEFTISPSGRSSGTIIPQSTIRNPQSRFPAPFAVIAVQSGINPQLDDLFHYLNQFGENFEYLNLLLLLPGTILLAREMWRGDRLALTLIFTAVVAMVWIRLNQIGAINGRYFLTAYLMALPTEAVGILWLLRAAASFARRRRWRVGVPAAAGAGLIAFFLTGAFTGGQGQRTAQRELGDWLRERYGPLEEVSVDTRSARVGYFARGRMPSVSYYNAGDGPPPKPPDAIIVGRPAAASVRNQAAQQGLRSLPARALPAAGADFEVFVRGPRTKAIADSDRARRD